MKGPCRKQFGLVNHPFQHTQCPELDWYNDGNTYAKGDWSQNWIPVINWYR